MNKSWVIAFLFISSLVSLPTIGQAQSFSDLANNQSHYNEIMYLTSVEPAIITGFPDGTFGPSKPVTNSQVAIMVARALNLSLDQRTDPGFLDVTPKTSGYEAIAALVEEGYLPKEPYYRPYLPVTREEMARLFVRAFDLKGRNQTNFYDVPTTYWAYPYITSLAVNGITTGYPDGIFSPKQSVMRAHFASFLARSLNEAFRISTQTIARGIDFGFSKEQVQRIERGKLVNETVEKNMAYQTYRVKKYEKEATVTYVFHENKLIEFIYHLQPERFYQVKPTSMAVKQIYEELGRDVQAEFGLPAHTSDKISNQGRKMEMEWHDLPNQTHSSFLVTSEANKIYASLHYYRL